jgi:DNA-binding NarL/FixJ family response regulator
VAPKYEQLPLFPNERGDRVRLVTVKRHLVPEAIARYPKLTQRLVEVAELLAEENSNPQIAARLGLARNTIRRYVENLMMITDADSRSGIVMALTTPPPDAPIRLRAVGEE